jgi:acyl-coenzyme A thioesterase PaaI-like protein
MSFRTRLLEKFVNFWPPFLFSGIKVIQMSRDNRYVKVMLKLRFWNANYIGTQYGGSIFSLTDPFYMLMLIKNLGPEYRVIDKAARINYLKLGKSDLFAEFTLTEEELEGIRQQVAKEEKIDWKRLVQVKDRNGEVVAEIERTIYIKKKTR